MYLAGTFFYLATQGLCWARSVALIVEIVGPETRDASTLYSLLNAAVSIPVLYVVWLDGIGFRNFGTHGLLLIDALLNLFTFGIVATIFITRGMGLRSVPDASDIERQDGTHAQALAREIQKANPHALPGQGLRV